MKRFQTVYVEITNVCNLACDFCPGTRRKKEFMSPERFETILRGLKPYTDYIHLHVLGEPLLHPQLEKLLVIASTYGIKVCITTNGTLLPEVGKDLLKHSNLHKISISLQAKEVNLLLQHKDDYLHQCFLFGHEASKHMIVVYRLWNEGGANRENEHILELMRAYFPNEWQQHHLGAKLTKNVYLEHGRKFVWPDLSKNEEMSDQKTLFCFGLRTQIGVLVDGTVVPCCLDHEGDIALGNLLESPLGEIVESERAMMIYQGFSNHQAVEALCQSCGYAKRFQS